jgi:glycosidase
VWHRASSGYYYGVFWDGMPDLNYANPDVTAAIKDATRFWAEEMGVDGFRIDAIKHLIEEGERQENTGATHEWFGDYFDFYKGLDPDLFAVGEAWTATREIINYTGDEVDIAFEFDLALSILSSARSRNARAVAMKMGSVVRDYPPLQYATFLTNHDQNRVVSVLDNSDAKAAVAATILLTSPGVPFIYYGEEIGMTGVKPDEDLRRPMQWAGDGPGVGFTSGTPWRAPAADYPERNVALQTDAPDSLLNHYRALIALRNEHEALRVGDWLPVVTRSSGVYAFVRETESETILVVVNLASEPTAAGDYALELDESGLVGPLTVETLLGAEAVNGPALTTSGGFTGYVPVETLGAQSSLIIRLR